MAGASTHEGRALWGQRGPGTQVPGGREGAKPGPGLTCSKKTFWNRAQLKSQSIIVLKVGVSGDWGWMDSTRHLLFPRALMLLRPASLNRTAAPPKTLSPHMNLGSLGK